MKYFSQGEESSGQPILDGISGQRLSSDENNPEYNLPNSSQQFQDTKRKNHRVLKQGGQNIKTASSENNNLKMKVAEGDSDQQMEEESEKMMKKKNNDFPKIVTRLIKNYIEKKIDLKHSRMEQEQKIFLKKLLSQIKTLLPEQSKFSPRKRQHLDKDYLQKLLKPDKEVNEADYRRYVLQKIHSILSDNLFIQQRLIGWKKILPENVKKYLRLIKLLKIQCRSYHRWGTERENEWEMEKGERRMLGSLDVRFDQLQQIQLEVENNRQKNKNCKKAQYHQY